LAVTTAKDVLMFAGRKPKDESPAVPILIKDSNVQLLVQVAKEIEDYERKKVGEK
jgi:hypothetical protein